MQCPKLLISQLWWRSLDGWISSYMLVSRDGLCCVSVSSSFDSAFATEASSFGGCSVQVASGKLHVVVWVMWLPPSIKQMIYRLINADFRTFRQAQLVLISEESLYSAISSNFILDVLAKIWCLSKVLMGSFFLWFQAKYRTIACFKVLSYRSSSLFLRIVGSHLELNSQHAQGMFYPPSMLLICTGPNGVLNQILLC